MSTTLSRVLVITGAGISAESGIPTFRGKDGYWRTHDPTKLATIEAFRRDPALVWEWYCERREHIRRSQPNAAHQAVVRLAAHSREFLLLTQNVDNLHARAQWEGQHLPAGAMVQIHGDIFITRCIRCSFERRDDLQDDPARVPECPRCEAPLRPGVTWFGEQLPADEVNRVEAFLDRGPCDLVIVIGTTAAFGYIVRWAQLAAQGGQLIEINPDETPLSPFAGETIRQPAAISLPPLVARVIEG